MKVFAVRDEEEEVQKDLAYLIYFENGKQFFIELPDDADPWETPLILSSFAKRREQTLNAYWSKLWVRQRIVPTDRQNIGQILKANGLEEYDEFQLLQLAQGRCAQDHYYLAPVEEQILQSKFPDRYEKKVEDVIPLQEFKVIVFFRNGIIKKCDLKHLRGNDRQFAPVLRNQDIFSRVSVAVGGYGIAWGENLMIPDHELYEQGETVPLCREDFVSFVQNRIVSTAEAAELLGCSRQNLNELTAKGKLHPVKVEQKSKLFLKSDIQKRLWK